MAVGIPASGIGTIFYILLTIAIILSKIVQKILAFLKKASMSDKPSTLLKFPTLAFILCVILLMYMNITGFRPVVPGSQQVAVPISASSYLWILSVFAASFFTVFMLLFHFRANARVQPDDVRVHKFDE